MRSRSFAAVSLLIVAMLVVAGAVHAYDSGREDEIAAGVRIAGVDVGGLTEEQARERVRQELAAPLRRSVVARAGDRRFKLTAKAARVRVDVDGMVADARERSRGGTVLSRTWRGVTGAELDVDVEPRVAYSDAAVRRFVKRVRSRASRKPRDAKVDFSAASLSIQRARTGRAIDPQRLRNDVVAALGDPGGDRRIVAKLRKTKPKVGTKQLAKKYPTIVTIDRGSYRLRLFKKLELVKTYPIAVGKAGLETPAGLYDIQNKAVNPAWHVPNSAWAGELAGRVIPPGPENPIKSRWMGIYDGAGIHGTDARYSIGTNASHGCIRMLIEDVTELYEKVPVGAPVYIA
jgi:lipoprotein-anchoring transpeptidase ErfK/SrfK